MFENKFSKFRLIKCNRIKWGESLKVNDNIINKFENIEKINISKNS